MQHLLNKHELTKKEIQADLRRMFSMIRVAVEMFTEEGQEISRSIESPSDKNFWSKLLPKFHQLSTRFDGDVVKSWKDGEKSYSRYISGEYANPGGGENSKYSGRGKELWPDIKGIRSASFSSFCDVIEYQLSWTDENEKEKCARLNRRMEVLHKLARKNGSKIRLTKTDKTHYRNTRILLDENPKHRAKGALTLESHYIQVRLNELQDAGNKLSDTLQDTLFLDTETGAGWGKDFDHTGPPNVLNTCEIGRALAKWNALNSPTRQSPTHKDIIKKARKFVLENRDSLGFWTTTRQLAPISSPLRTAFAINFLLRAESDGFVLSAKERKLLSKSIEWIFEELSKRESSEDSLEIFEICQCIAVTCRFRVEANAGDEKLIPKLTSLYKKTAQQVERQTFAKYDAGETTSDSLARVVFEASQLAIAFSELKKMSRFDDGDEILDSLCARILTDRECPLPDTLIENNPYAFTHWVEIWAILALNLNPRIDRLFIIERVKDIIRDHMDIENMSVVPSGKKNGEAAVWAMGHLLSLLAEIMSDDHQSQFNHYRGTAYYV